MDDKLIQFFRQGYMALASANEPDRARRNFNHCMKLSQDDPQADIFRGIAACEPGKYAQPKQVQNIWLHLHNFGDLSRAAFSDPAQDIDVSVEPHSRSATKFFDLDLDLTTTSRVSAAHAMNLTNAGQYAAAHEVLERSEIKTQATAMVMAILYYRTGRWPDAIAAAEPLRAAYAVNTADKPLIDPESRRPANNVLYQSLSYLISGTAFAYLGNRATAERHLTAIQNSEFVAIAAEANRILGLLARAGGSETEAQDLFAAAQAVSDNPAAAAAKANPRAVLEVTSEAMIAARTSYWDISTEPSLAKAQQDATDQSRHKLLEEADAELQQQIGMTDVKAQVVKRRADVAYEQQQRARGIPTSSSSNHMIFSGPPGTGKTTVARIMAKSLAGLGVCRTDNLVEVSRTELVAKYEGQSAKLTAEVVQSALGGVLFIDEAYELVQDRDGRADAFGQEAVTQLLLDMEKHREDLVVIIAGYERDLRRFLATNPGLESRFSEWIRFTSYSADEIAEIADSIGKTRHSFLEPAAREVIRDTIEMRILGIDDASGQPLIDKAGNGRFARKIIEASERERSSRLSMIDTSNLSNEEFSALTYSDVSTTMQSLVEQIR